jgi:type II secretory pathway component GspD/PulD (secretin)
MVRVKDGETVVIGGLIRNEVAEILTKVPILGNIPIIGSLFRHRGGSSTDNPRNKTRELLVFITPHIVKDSIGELARAEKVTIPAREQGTASGVKRELAINAVLNSFERKGNH